MKLNSEEIEIKHLDKNDIPIAQQLFRVLQQVFGVEKRVETNESHIIRLLANPGFICLAAVYKSEVIGGLTAYELPMYDVDRSEIFIYDIAIKFEFQRMGIGKKLMAAIKQYANENGAKQLFVDASEADKHALDFYRSMNGKQEKVVQFTFNV